MISECKWVNEVQVNVPYTPTVALLDLYKCDFYAHGDDLALNADGQDSCAEMKNAGRYKEFKRTRGVSTTNIVGKLLLQCKHLNREDDHPKESFKEPVTTSEVKSII